jgi:hypothetical protein
VTTATPAGVSPGTGPERARRRGQPLAAAKTPLAPGTITVVGVLLAAAVTAAGVIAVRDSLVQANLAAGTAWTSAVVGRVDKLGPGAWLVPLAVVLVGVGLWLLVVAVRPRPRTGVALDAVTGVFLRPRDVARIARSAAQDVDGVTSARATATARRIFVTVRATSSDVDVAPRVTEAVTGQLTALAAPPTIRVSVKSAGDGR